MQSQIATDGGAMHDAELTIRPMEARDAAVAAELTHELGYLRTAGQVQDWLATVENRGTQAAFVAELAGAVVGWIEVSIERRLQADPFGLIGGLVIGAAFRGRGIGRLLCQRAEEWAREQGIGRIRVTSRSTREGAHRFYLRDGYCQTKLSLIFEKNLHP